MISGKDLISLGYKPSKYFGEALQHINSNNLELGSLSFKEYMESIVKKYIKEINILEPHTEPVKYYQNITADEPEEIKNLSDVISNMDSVMKTPTVVSGCIMPDTCPTGPDQIPVGGVVVTKNSIHPAMHSADICCSVMLSDFGHTDPKRVLDVAIKETHFGAGGRFAQYGYHSHLEDNKSLYSRILDNYYTKDYIEKALSHMGTQGDGNHFLFVGRNKDGRTTMVTHHGSRGFGASVYKKGMSIAEKYRKEISPKTNPKNAWISYTELDGQLYWDALQIIRDWTKLNHTVIHQSIANKLQTPIHDNFWNEHNFVFKDNDLFYHAKGATPLANKFVPDSSDGLRIIPLNMSQPVLIVRGDTTATNLGFAPHGAGRNLSRSQHKKNNSHKTVEQIFTEETKGLDVRFYSGKVDISELPSAYKNAESVKQQIQQFGLGTIVDEIMPYGCVMAGESFMSWKK